MKDVMCFGEALIDFICTEAGSSVSNGKAFEKKAGGAPANVAVGCARLGAKAGFIGKVGTDPFGSYLKETLLKEGVDGANFVQDPNYKTSLAFVSIMADGERDFSFFREPGADTMLSSKDLNVKEALDCRLFHYGSISLIGGPTKRTLLKLLKKANAQGIFMSYDPNLRPALWKNNQAALKGILEGMRFATLVKVSEEELEFITGLKDKKAAAQKIHKIGPKVVMITRGKDGCFISTKFGWIEAQGVSVKAIDTTGAGDAFTAAFLYQLCQLSDMKRDCVDEAFLKRAAAFANRAGALVTTRTGALEAMPRLNELN